MRIFQVIFYIIVLLAVACPDALDTRFSTEVSASAAAEQNVSTGSGVISTQTRSEVYTVDEGSSVDLFLLPASREVDSNSTFNITLEAQCNGQPVSGLSAFLNFEPSRLEVQSIIPGAAVPLVVQNSYSNISGTIDFRGIFTQPYPDQTFVAAIITLKAKSPIEETQIVFSTVSPRKSLAELDGVSILRNLAGATIKILVGNRAPTEISLSAGSIAENQPVETLVGLFSTVDPDTGDSFAYTLVTGPGSDDNGYFSIDGDSLRTSAVFDFETRSSYSIRVRSTDQGSLYFENVFIINITSLGPVVILSSATGNPTNVSPIPLTAAFSRNVVGFTIDDITVENGAASDLQGGPQVYSFKVTPTSQGLVTVDIGAGKTQDAEANGNIAAVQFSRVYDSIAPIVTLASTSVNPTNVSPIPVTASFNENMTGFAIDDIGVDNGTPGDLQGGPRVFTFKVTPDGEGPVTINISAGRAFDSASNGNIAALQLSRTYDSIAPSVVLTSTTDPATNVSPIPVTATFSENVSGFTLDDFIIGNGAAANFGGGPQVYYCKVTPSGQGTVTVNINAGKAMDAAGNSNTAAIQLSRIYDGIAPAVTLSTTTSDPTNISPIPITVTFSENVTGLTASNIVVTNGVKSSISGSGSVYTFYVTPSSQGLVTVDIFSGKARDAAGNVNTAAKQLSRTYDSIAPAVTLTSTAANNTNISPIPVTVTFSEAVNDFVVGDLSITNGTAGNFSGGPQVYTFQVAPSGQGLVTANLAAGKAHDAAGNSNPAVQLSRTYDSIGPTVTLTSPASPATNFKTVPVIATFSEDITGFTLSDIAAPAGSVSGLTGSGHIYTFYVTCARQGLITVDISNSSVLDAAGNANTAAAQLSWFYDSIAPTVALSSTAGNPTNVSPIPVTAVFNENVTGLSLEDITVTNASVTALSGSGRTYSFNVIPYEQGPVTVYILSGVVQDVAGNGNTASALLSRTYDSISPSVTLTSTAGNPTRLSPIPVTATFSENVTGFTIDDIAVGNGVAGDFAGGPRVYTFKVTPILQGPATVNIGPNKVLDVVGYGNTAAAQLSLTYDSKGPTVSLTSAAGNNTNVSPIPVTATFGESVSGFTIQDITVSHGIAGDLSGGPQIYSFKVTPSGQGTVSVNIGAGKVQDLAGNSNTAALPLSRVYDSLAPGVTLATTENDPTKVSPILFTATFNENVTGFAIEDITVGNGFAGNLSGGPQVYTFRVNPSSQGPVTVSIGAGKAQDAAGNTNTAASQLALTYDTLPPTATLASTASNPTNVSPIPVTATFSENVTGFSLGDISVNNGAISGFTGSGNTYIFNVTPQNQGPVTVNIGAGKVQDAAGNGNTAAVQFTRTYDTLAPAVTLASSAVNPTNVSPIPVTATFSENVTGFSIDDIAVGNGAAGDLKGGPQVYTFKVTPSSQGSVTINIGAGKVLDAVGYGNTAALQLSRTYDSIAPAVTLSSTAGDPTNISSIPVTVTFSENVTGFIVEDISVDNGAAGEFGGGPKVYTFKVIPAGQGMVTVNINADKAQDAAGNSNTAAVPLSRAYDGIAPAVILSTTVSDPTNVSPIQVTATFSENVTGLTLSNFTVTNGVKSGITGSGSVYTFYVTPTSQGLVTVDLFSGKARDAAGNVNTAALQLSRTYDSIAPSVILTSTTAGATNTSPIPVSASFSEPVSGFDLADIVVDNGAAGDISGGPQVYTFRVTPAGQGMVTVNIGGNKALDAAGNGNAAASELGRVYDSVSPTVTLSSVSADPVYVSPIPVTASFSESVTGFTIEDIVITNGAAGEFSGSGQVYTFNVTPSTRGLVTVNIGAGKALDAAGNGNAAALPLIRNYDSQAITVILSSTAGNPTNMSPIPVTATFNKDVTGFILDDILVGNGFAGEFSGGPQVYSFNIVPSGQGPVTVDIPAGAAEDGMGNHNIAAGRLSLTYDSISPTVQLTTTAGDPTGVSPILVIVIFSEPVSGFNLADTRVTNGVESELAGSGSIYTFKVTPSSQGLVTINIGAGKALDAAGNGNTAALQLNRTYDSIAPTVSLATAAGDPTYVSPIPVIATFSEDVTGFTAGDITVSNGIVGNFSGSGGAYAFSVIPNTVGAVTVNIAGGVAQDAAGNVNVAALQLSLTYESLDPGVTLSSTVINPTNVSPLPVTAAFNKAVTGFTVDDIVVDNGTAGSFGGGPQVYTFSVTPAAQGLVTVDIPAGAAQDGLGNPSLAANQLSLTYDSIAPAVLLSTIAGSPTNLSPIPVTAVFSEDVTGFSIADITIGNGTAGGFSGSGSIYTFNVTPHSQGAVTINIANGIAQDAAGNGNTAALQLGLIFDSSAPSVTLFSAVSDPTNISPIPVTAAFSEDVFGFTIEDIVILNGAIGNFGGGPQVYSFKVTPAGQGPVTVNINAGKALDAAGNGNTAAVELGLVYDSLAPVLTLYSSAGNLTHVSPLPVTATFSENVTGFVLEDIIAGNGSAGDFAGGPQVYTFNVTPAGQGLVIINIAAGAAQDSAGNPCGASGQLSLTFDSVIPSVIHISPDNGDVDISVNAVIKFTFSETMDASTIIASNFSLMNGDSPVPGVLSYEESTMTATFAPSAYLASDSIHTATISDDVSDLADNHLSGDYSWIFTTGSHVRASTRMDLTASHNPSISGEDVVFNAAVSVEPPGTGIPTGSVVFKVNGAPLATEILDESGQAETHTSTLPVGEHIITAEYSGSVDFEGSLSNTLVQVVYPYTLFITTDSLPDSTVKAPYSQPLQAINGKKSYRWSIIKTKDESLPPGLTLNSSSGILKGTPKKDGTFTFTVKVTDSSKLKATDTRKFSVTIHPAVTISYPVLPEAEKGASFPTWNLSAGGGKGPYTWVMSKGSLPAGLTWNETSAEISGMPVVDISRMRTYPFTIKLTDSLKGWASASFILKVYPSITIKTGILSDGDIGVSYKAKLQALGGKNKYTWSTVVGSLPDGLELDPDKGIISGVPEGGSSGTWNFTVKASDKIGFADRDLHITINAPLVITVTPQITGTGTVGDVCSYSLTAGGGAGGYKWSITGRLPTGLKFSSKTNTISGALKKAGNYTFTIKLTDRLKGSVTETISFSVNNPD